MKIINNFFGWYEKGEAEPAHNPSLHIDCPHCGDALDDNIVTVSFCAGGDRSYFYRMHKKCSSDDSQREIESLIVDLETQNETE